MFSKIQPHLLVVLAFVAQIAGAIAAHRNKTTVHLLALVPYREGSPNTSPPCVDRGEELLPAAQLAADVANENILSDFQLEIVPVPTASCNEDSFSLTLANFVQKLTNRSYSVVGVVGMMCSSAVLSVSPLASHEEINILQITSSAVSPSSISEARERVNINNLYQTAPPSTEFNDVLIEILKTYNVTQLAVIRHVGTFFIDHDIIATDLNKKIKANDVNISSSNFEVNVDHPNVIMNSSDIEVDAVSRMLSSIATNSTGLRVIYATVTSVEARLMLCLARKMLVQVLHPRNQWIFHSLTLSDLVQPTLECTQEDMKSAVEGIVLLQHSGETVNSTSENLSHTNYTYDKYLEAYRNKLNLNGVNNSLCDMSPGVIHTNALYDSVLAFALAINNSLVKKDLISYEIRNSNRSDIAEQLKVKLNCLSFFGAGGHITFDNNTHEVVRNNTVDKLVVLNGTVNEMEASYTIHGSFNLIVEQPPSPLLIITLVLIVILVIVHTITLLLFIYYWNDPDIKATSPALGIIILIACYMLDLSLLLTVMRFLFEKILEKEFVAFCTAENWLLYIGIQLIFATLMMRLVRVYRIFFHYSKLGKVWSDYGLTLFILMLITFGVVILTIWMAADTPFRHVNTIFMFESNEPHFITQFSCQSRYFAVFPIWIILLLVYTGILMVIVLLLAIRTRKVKIESFKDTKTVNIFIYTTVICFMFLIILSLIFGALRDQIAVFVTRVLALGSVAIASAFFLFLPKIYQAQYARRHPHKKSLASQSSSAFIAGNPHIMTTAF